MDPVLLVGCGAMGIEYAKVLEALNVSYIAIGRSPEGCENFRKRYPHVHVVLGGLEAYCTKNKLFNKAIVAVGIEELKSITEILIKNRVKEILVEKPAGLDIKEIEELKNIAAEKEANVFVAYNRRFYSSTIEAKKLIDSDGGVSSFNFEFTEWGHQIEKLGRSSEIKENWLLANSSHVIDLAFYLGGYPKELSCYVAGELSWHSRGSKFAGAGICENDVLFSYCANWDAPGRWGVEILTQNYRFIFRPMEKLSVIRKGSVLIEMVEIDDSLDIEFKPGLFLQTKAFIKGNTTNFCKLVDQKKIIEDYYLKISTY